MRIILILIFLTTVSAFSQKLKNTAWLIGEWQFETEQKIIVEKWRQVSIETYEGISFSINKETADTTFSETLRLLEMSGDIFYLPYVKHNPRPIAFKLISTKSDSLVFENNDHDFPHRVIYIPKGNKIFTVRVEGIRKGKVSGFEMKFNKVQSK